MARQLNVAQMVFEGNYKACTEALSKAKPVSQWRLVSFAKDALRTSRSNLSGISMPRAGNLAAITWQDGPSFVNVVQDEAGLS